MKRRCSFLRLFRFEMRKNFLSLWMVLFLIALLIANGWKLNWEYEKYTKSFSEIQPVYEEFYGKWSGTITGEKIADLMTVYGPLEKKAESFSLSEVPGSGNYMETESGDYSFFSTQFAKEMKYDYLYVNQAVEISRNAKAQAQLYDRQGNSYAAKEARSLAQTFQGRSIPGFADTRYLEVWENHDYSSMLVLLLVLFGLCTVFVTERETQMYMLQRTSKLGGGATVAAKLLSSALYIIVVCLLFYGQDFLTLQLLSGHWDALSSPVYALRLMEATPLTMTIGQYVLWSMGVKTLGALCCGCMILLASCLCRQVLTTFVAGFGGILVLVILQTLCRTRVALKWFNPMELMITREIVTDTVFINVFGQPVHLYAFVIAGILLTMAVLIGLILRFQPGRMKRRGR